MLTGVVPQQAVGFLLSDCFSRCNNGRQVAHLVFENGRELSLTVSQLIENSGPADFHAGIRCKTPGEISSARAKDPDSIPDGIALQASVPAGTRRYQFLHEKEFLHASRQMPPKHERAPPAALNQKRVEFLTFMPLRAASPAVGMPLERIQLSDSNGSQM